MLNNRIDSNTGKIVTENKGLTEKSIELTKKIEPLIVGTKLITLKIDSVLNEVKNEQNGEKSIPLVNAYFRKKDFQFYGGDPRESIDTFTQNNHNWVLNFYTQNIGNYDIKNIQVTEQYLTSKSKAMPQNVLINPIAWLRVGGKLSIQPEIVIANAEVQYIEGVRYTLDIKWKAYYTYVFIINEDLSYQEYYKYKNSTYQKDQFLEKIRKDLK